MMEQEVPVTSQNNKRKREINDTGDTDTEDSSYDAPPKNVCKYAAIISQVNNASMNYTREEKTRYANFLFALAMHKHRYYLCPAPSIDLEDPDRQLHELFHERPRTVLRNFALHLKGMGASISFKNIEFSGHSEEKMEDALNESVSYYFNPTENDTSSPESE